MHAHDVSVSCMMAYEKRGAFAVFQSPECLHWDQLLPNQTTNCRFSTLQGHTIYQEDRLACDLDLRVAVFGKDGMKEAVVGVAAIFDGHGGKEASEMASKKLLDYFLMHAVFGTYKQALLPSSNKDDMVCHAKDGAHKNSSTLGRSCFLMFVAVLMEEGYLNLAILEPLHGILKEALLRSIHDIDMEFSLEAEENDYFSGSTATVVLLLDGKYLVASVGDSKALKCSYEDSSVTKLYSKELTRDHHPDRKDEKARIDAAGGSVRVWGVPRVNGILAVSRSIGDISLKRYGVIAVPEVLGWQSLKDDDRYLVIASDDIFESLTPRDVCHLLQNSDIQETQVNSSLCASSSSLPDCIVNMAFREGSTDNLSAIVVPLK